MGIPCDQDDPPATPLPAQVDALSKACALAATGLGWLDPQHRLRWRNPSLSMLIGREDAPATGVALAELGVDSARLQDAARRAESTDEAVLVAGVVLPAARVPVDIRLIRIGKDQGLLLEVPQPSTPAAVPVSSSLRSLAHELKNPLGGLRGAAQLISRRVLDADLRAYAGIIVAEVDRLGALTDRLLAPVARRSMTRMNVHTALERVRLLLAADGVAVVRDYDPSLPEIDGDPDRLVQVLLNLGRNALEADARQLVLRTRFERAATLAHARGDAIRIDVVDDGRGVPGDVRATLFLPLVSGREGGTGLGLAIAHEVLAEHGGRIGFESVPGRTTFSCWLPVPAATTPAATPTQETPP
jgi:two-component system nitrogen regulation sensor histidine kinase GlnL